MFVLFGDKTIVTPETDMISPPDKKKRYLYHVILKMNERYNRKDVHAVYDMKPNRKGRYSSSYESRSMSLVICPVTPEIIKRAEQLLVLKLMSGDNT